MILAFKKKMTHSNDLDPLSLTNSNIPIAEFGTFDLGLHVETDELHTPQFGTFDLGLNVELDNFLLPNVH